MGDPQVYIFIVIGAFCLLIASLFAGNVEGNILGATDFSFSMTLLISFVLILVGGIFWVSAAKILNK